MKDCSSRGRVGVAGNTTDSGARDRLIWPAKIITGGDQQRTVLLHIARGVFVLEEPQDAPMLVMIKDDEIEAANLVRKQLTCRKGDQRELL